MNECENRNNYAKNIFIQISILALIAKTINFKISVSYQLHMINNVKGSAHYSKRIIRKKRLFCFVPILNLPPPHSLSHLDRSL